ncbi:hypothetical protein [Hyphomicrobium denitrificans]|uniref:hypothetical protein n=1 Tax=Hyphomicrobium denitrificans TaxID=53399 RepID=UPI001231D448|nr:hypothetical protein [Hyphomicrobium denitrificans]
MNRTADEQFLHRVETFLTRTGIAASRFGEMAANDRAFIADLRGTEREFRRSTLEKVEKFMDGFEAGVAHAGRRPSQAASDIRRSAAGS